MKVKNQYSISVFIISIILVIGVASGFFVTQFFKGNYTLGHAKIAYWSENFDSLTNDSQFIIEAQTIDSQEEFKYDDIIFVKTQVNIKTVVKGILPDDKKTLTILQTKIEDDPIIEKNGHVLLFLEKYNGSIIEDAYVCKGLFQGHYKIKNNKILCSKDSNQNLKEEIDNESAEKFIEKIKAKADKR